MCVLVCVVYVFSVWRVGCFTVLAAVPLCLGGGLACWVARCVCWFPALDVQLVAVVPAGCVRL